MAKFIDLTGKRFGRLIIKSRAENSKNKEVRWNCTCDCGNKTVVLRNSLRNGRTKSCRCISYENISGQRFGKLTVIKKIGVKLKRTVYECLCDCGNKINAYAKVLKNGNTKSCGCLKKYYSDRYLYLEHALYNDYINGAKRRKIYFEIEFEKFIDFTQGNCYYCGKTPNQRLKDHSSKVELFYNGLDRLDSKKGYINSNVVPCCIECNRLKMDRNRDDFLSWLKKCYDHLGLK